MKKNWVVGILIMILFNGLASLDSWAANEQQIVLIGHPSVVTALKKSEIEDIFLGKKTRWADDTKIDFVILGAPQVYSAFLKEYLGKTVFQYTNYWKKQVFTGKGRMPEAFSTSSAVIQYVSNTTGAISFVVAQDVDPTLVKVITVEP
jgi:ABC-type phosphate transport system substrate-binding protein